MTTASILLVIGKVLFWWTLVSILLAACIAKANWNKKQ